MQQILNSKMLDFLECPLSGENLALSENEKSLVSVNGQKYSLNAAGIPTFAESFCSEEGKAQQQHYDQIANAYLANLTYPHTQEYMKFLDDEFLEMIGDRDLGVTAELCCGKGEAFSLIGDKVSKGVGADVSIKMLEGALKEHSTKDNLFFIQADATRLPLKKNSFDSVFILGGIHHVPNREKLFQEVSRILKPGGYFYFREPVSDWFLWRIIRSIIYKLSPILDDKTERPLIWEETVPLLEKNNFQMGKWKRIGFLGFCLFMNSDVLFFNRLFRYIPGIRKITRAFALLDKTLLKISFLNKAGLQVISYAVKK